MANNNNNNSVVVVVVAVVALLAALSGGGGALARKQSPLLPAEGGKGRSRATECQFGKQLKELGTSWFADLGPPFGVMYCIRCQCVPVQKKRRIVARVQCKNIKNECPTPSCDEPVMLPGQCCKLCPQDIMDSPGIVRDVAPVPTPEEEERNMKHFAALLTGRTSMVLHRDDAVMSSSPLSHQELPVATARFTFHKKHLYYSFYTSASVRPRALQFVDHEGNILEEQALGDTEYGNNTGKVCGVWRRVPREYRRFLREERMLVTLMWPDNVSLSGLVVRYRTLSTELFSALLDVSPGADRAAMSGAGGGAIVSASSSAPTVHIHLTFNGVFSPHELYDVPITVRLEGADRQHVVLEEVVIVSKPAHELNEIEVVSPVTAADLRHLTRGKLRLVVENKRNPDALRLEGRVQTRVTCEVFQCLLSSADSDGEDDEASRLTPASGVGLFYVNRDGALVYTVQLDSLDNRPAALLTLVSGRGKRRLELEDLTPSLVSNNATGLLDRPSPRELEQLYAGDLSLNVATESASSLLRGRLAARPVADSRTGPVPVLLRRGEPDTPAGVTGLAWAAVDMECTLHYELFLSGLTDQDRQLELYWEELPFIAPFAPVSRRLLDEFSGSTLEGFVLGLTPEELARVENSVNYLEVREAAGSVLLRSPVLKVRVPAPCRPHYTDNSVPAAPSDPGGNDITACYHDDRFHDDGSQWSARGDPCAMCSCQRGRVVCDSMPCPGQLCGILGQTQPAGECCPVCITECCKRWKTLRCRYRKERKKGASGSAGGKKAAWYLGAFMSFLNAYVDDVEETTSNIIIEDTQEDDSHQPMNQSFGPKEVIVDSMFFVENEETLDPSGNEVDEALTPTQDRQNPAASTTKIAEKPKARKKDQSSLVDTVLKCMEKEPPPLDAMDHYCQSLAHTMKSLSARDQAYMKFQIQKLLFDLQFKE